MPESETTPDLYLPEKKIYTISPGTVMVTNQMEHHLFLKLSQTRHGLPYLTTYPIQDYGKPYESLLPKTGTPPTQINDIMEEWSYIRSNDALRRSFTVEDRLLAEWFCEELQSYFQNGEMYTVELTSCILSPKKSCYFAIIST